MRAIKPGAELSDEARLMLRRADALSEAANRLHEWAASPGTVSLEEVAASVARAAAEFGAAIAGHLEASVPTLEQLEWRIAVALERHRRAWEHHAEYFSAGSFFSDDPEEREEADNAKRASDETYRAYLDARREFRRHPDWVPKNKKKPKKKPGK